MNSLQVLGLRLGNAKAAIQRPNAPSSRAAPSTKGSNAQKAYFAKLRERPKLPLVEYSDAAVQFP